MGIPVVIAANGIGVPVTPVESNAPVMTITPNGFGAPIVLAENATPFIIEGFTPVDWDFQPFSMTAEEEGQWVGYSTGVTTTPQPAFGSISGEPTTETTLLALYNDTASGRYLVVFQGDYLLALQGLKLIIGGFPIDSYETQLIAGNTWVRFDDGVGNLTPADYQIEFGF
jgi:hypothetical protein